MPRTPVISGFALLVALTLGVPATGFGQEGELDRFDRAVQRLVAKLAPSVVAVRIVAVSDPNADGTSVAGSVRRSLYRASGVIGSREGEIITVIAGGLPEEQLEIGEQLGIEIELHDGPLLAARWIAADPETGLTLLAIENPPKKLTPVRYASTLPAQAAIVVSIGADGFELGHVAHPARGIRHRGVGQRDASFPRGIVTTIAAQPGDVGGLLANPEGELVGMLAFSLVLPKSEQDDEEEKSGETGLGPRGERRGAETAAGDATTGEENPFDEARRPAWARRMGTAVVTNPTEGGPLGRAVAIPADLLQIICRSLRTDGRMVRGALGATFQFHHPALAGPTHYGAGALVRKLVAQGSAEIDGLQVGDVIQKVDGRELHRPEDLLWFRERVEYGRIGSSLQVQVARMENRRVVSRAIRLHIGTRPEGSDGDGLEPPPKPDCTPVPVGPTNPGGSTAEPPLPEGRHRR